jgi:hypothetical protein
LMQSLKSIKLKSKNRNPHSALLSDHLGIRNKSKGEGAYQLRKSRSKYRSLGNRVWIN